MQWGFGVVVQVQRVHLGRRRGKVVCIEEGSGRNKKVGRGIWGGCGGIYDGAVDAWKVRGRRSAWPKTVLAPKSCVGKGPGGMHADAGWDAWVATITVNVGRVHSGRTPTDGRKM